MKIGHVEAIARFLGMLRRDCGRDFVIGIANAETGITDDLLHVTTLQPDMVRLRAIVGAALRPLWG